MTWLRQIAAIVALPGVVTVVIPYFLTSPAGTTRPGWGLSAPASLVPQILGVVMSALGLLLMIQTISLFMTVGRGTLAPWDPPQRLVVRGIYRHVRNPMITGVICVLAGEAVVLGLLPVLIWCLIFTLVNLIYIPLLEEPQLSQRFGGDDDEYRQHVPRWIPRLTPWIPIGSVGNQQS